VPDPRSGRFSRSPRGAGPGCSGGGTGHALGKLRSPHPPRLSMGCGVSSSDVPPKYVADERIKTAASPHGGGHARASASDCVERNPDIEQIKSFLLKVPLFQSLTAADYTLLAKACEPQDYKTTETVIKQHDIGKEFFLLKEGQARVEINESSGERKPVALLQAGDYFGETALLHDQPRAASIVAETDLRTLKITRAKFQELDLCSKITFPCRKAVGAAKGQKAVSKPPTPKTSEERDLIAKALKANENLQTMVNLTADRLNALIDMMWKEPVTKSTLLIKQGDQDAGYFYVVQDGEFDVIVAPEVGVKGKVVAVKRSGGSFGELALLYQAPRAATVKARINSEVWVIDRTHFKSVLIREEAPEKLKEYVKILGKVPLLAPLLQQEREAVARTLVERTFQRGKAIYKQNDKGICMYILCDGEVSISRDGKDTTKMRAGGKKTGNSKHSLPTFGERQLISAERRGATVTPTTIKVRVLVLDRDLIAVAIGPLEELLKRSSPNGPDGDGRTFGRIARRDLVVLGLLGCGGFGAVELVEHKVTKDTYALKALSKGYVVQSGMEASVMNEKTVLLMCDSVFIIKLYETYNGMQSLYFLLEAALGGELHATYNRKGLYGSEKHARFYVAAAICAFEYLHIKRVIYRDLKPENMILDVAGQVKLIDMGLAKVVVGKTYTACGTPDYFAPEIIAQTGHGFAVDWWCVGILTFELMTGAPPFEADDPMATYAKIKKGIDKVTFPDTCQGSCAKFIRELVQAKPESRLPLKIGGMKNIWGHVWFEDFDWKVFMKGIMEPPYKPNVKSNKDMANFKANKADRPQIVKYKDNGTGWDRDFATFVDPDGEPKTSDVPSMEPPPAPKKRVMDTE